MKDLRVGIKLLTDQSSWIVIMLFKKASFIIIAIGVISVTAAYADSADPRPITASDSQLLKLVDQQLYCYTGWGTQNMTFKLDNQVVYARDQRSSYMPSYNITNSPKLDFGCAQNGFSIEFILYNGAFEFQKEIIVDDTMYNAVDYEQSSIMFGYSFKLIPHRFYINAGIGYTQGKYKLGLYGNEYATETTAGAQNSENGLVHVSMVVFINHFFFVNYQQMQSIRSKSVFYYANQLSLNFYRRF